MAMILEGYKVIELATEVSVPLSAKMLSDYGADVIKVETLKGDNWRHAGLNLDVPAEDGNNPMFTLLNGGKKLVSLDLKSAEGMAVLRDLMAGADVFMTNIRKPSLQRLGIWYDDIRDELPGLVYCHFTGYGEVGPDAGKPGYDSAAYWCRTGSRLGWVAEGARPLKQTGAYGDSVTGLMTYGGIVTALLSKERTGRGCFLTNSLLGTGVLVNGTTILAAQEAYGHKFPEPEDLPPNPFVGDYLCRDGRWIALVGIGVTGPNFKGYARLLGMEDILGDPRCANEKTLKDSGYYTELRARIASIMAGKDSDEWLRLIEEADLVASRISGFADVSKDEQVLANHYLEETEFADGSRALLARPPVHFAGYEMRENKSAGGVGADNDEVTRLLWRACGRGTEAQRYADEKLWLTEENATGVTVLAYTGEELLEGRVVLPVSFAGKPVTRLAGRLFYECKRITEAVIPDTVTEIGDAAFAICNGLERVNFPAGLSTIPADCFNECGFTELDIPDSVKTIRRGAFVNNRDLKTIGLPGDLKEIELMTFAGCMSLESIELPAGVRKIGDGAFSSCSSLSKADLPQGLEEIGAMAFLGCTSLKNVKLPGSIKKKGDIAFPQTTELTEE